jgi:endonuclease YncB( thermonuclease family)
MIKAVILLFSILQACAVETKPIHVLEVIDGDTIKVAADLGGVQHSLQVRLLYVDAPEVTDNAPGESNEIGSLAATWLRSKLTAGTKVVLWSPSEEFTTDQFGRVLAIVFPESGAAIVKSIMGVDTPTAESINGALMKAGWSPYWTKEGEAPESISTLFLLAQHKAQKERAGIWSIDEKWIRDKANEPTALKSADDADDK